MGKKSIKTRHNLAILNGYLRTRANIEGVAYELNDKFFIQLFKNGTRCFFGVTVNGIGFPLSDEQEPNDHPGLLEEYLRTNN